MHRTTTERVKEIQRRLGVEPDGALGPQTLTAFEAALDRLDAHAPKERPRRGGLVVSQRALDALVAHEIGSKAYYRRFLRRPVWPGGDSGVTIGIGYDLGYQSEATFRGDWQAHLPERTCERLAPVCGLRGSRARARIDELRDVSIPLRAATAVFEATVLPRYVGLTLKAFPGVEELAPDAAGALVSLIYNRGASMSGDSRREMRAIRDHVKRADYAAIAGELRDMKRIWAGRGLDGLLKRREDEAEMVEGARQSLAQAAPSVTLESAVA